MKVHGNWVLSTTKKEDIGDAVVEALQLFEKEEAKDKPPEQKTTFSHFCKRYRTRLLTKRPQKAIYPTYLRHLEKYVKPFFGDMESVCQKDLDAFYDWHAETMGKVPTKSTINSVNVVLRSLFADALEERFIDHMLKCSVRDRGLHGEPREAFTLEDYRKLYRKSKKWKEKKTHRKISQYKRVILHDMILIIANTGIRPGNEIRNLEWRDVIITNENIKVRVRKGKTGKKRTILPRKTCRIYFERLRETTGRHKHCFCMPDGSPFRWESHMFDDLLEYAGLPPYYSLYSLRHFYATQRIIRKKVPYSLLAKQMGTSPKMLAEHYDQSLVEAFPEYFVE
jgi:integrase